MLIIILIVLLLVFGVGGGGAYYGRQNWGNIGGVIPLILIVFVLSWLFS